MSTLAILAEVYNATLLTIGIVVLVFGSGPERVGAMINLVASAVTGALIVSGVSHWGGGHIATWLVDLTVVAAFFCLAISSTRFWPIWCFGFSLCDVLLHIAALILPQDIAFYYESAQVLWAYASLLALAVATIRLDRHERGKSSCGWR